MIRLICALVVTGTFVHVQAAPITGWLWQVPDAIAQNAVPANIPARPPDVTFQVNAPLNFNNGSTIDAFLMSGGAFNVVAPAGVLDDPISASLIRFSGEVAVTQGQQFTVTHDDGLTLIIGGLLVIDLPNRTPPIQTTRTYNGPTGVLPFTLVYGECCSGEAVLQISLAFEPDPTSSVPEPGSRGLFASGIALAITRLCSRQTSGRSRSSRTKEALE